MFRSLLLLVFLAATPAGTREVTDGDRRAVTALAAQFGLGLAEGPAADMLQTLPPPVIEVLAARTGTTPERFTAVMAGQIDGWRRLAQVESLDMDVNGAPAGRTPAGRPYLLIPTEMVVASEMTGRVRSTGVTLALEIEGRWYMAQVHTADLQSALREAFLDFEDLTFPEQEVKPLR